MSIVLATAVLDCLRASRLPLAGDELLTFYTVNQPSISKLIHFQATTPIVLEPPAFEVLAHIGGFLFHDSLLSIRLVSILSLLLLQLCLYGIVKPLAGDRAALFAMIFAFDIPTTVYGYYLRPYGLLMAMSAGAFFCWAHAAYRGRFRKLALFGVVLSLLVAVTCQFYGILALLPMLVGELHRSWRKRKLDWAILGALAIGALSVVLDMPFLKATLPYKEQMPRDPRIGVASIGYAYRALLLSYHHFVLWPMRPIKDFAISAVATLIFLATFYLSYRRVRLVKSGEYLPVWSALTALVLLPFPCVFIAYHYTHTFGARHCCECALGFVALLAIAASSTFQRWSSASLWLLGFFIILPSLYRYGPYSLRPKIELDRYSTPPKVGAWLDAHPDQLIYATVDNCLGISLFGDPKLFPRIRCIYSQNREIKYSHRQITYLTEMALAHHTDFPLQFVSYEEFRAHVPAMLLYGDFAWEEWIPDSLQDDGASMEPLDNGPGEHWGGTFYSVTAPLPAASGGLSTR